MSEGYDFLDSASVSLRGRKSTSDSTCEAVVERDIYSRDRDSDGLTGFFAVHGGYAGATASEFLAQKLRECVCARPEYKDKLYEALEKGMLDCQKGLYGLWTRSGLMHGSNSTVMVVRDGYCFFVNAGAGAAVLSAAEGNVKVLTTTSARFDELAAFTCSKYLPDCEDEFVILGCDGFWEKIVPEQAVHMARSALRKYKSVKFACEKLAYAAQVSGTRRNINVQIVMLSSTHTPVLDRGNIPLDRRCATESMPVRTFSDNASISPSRSGVPSRLGSRSGLQRETSFARPPALSRESSGVNDVSSETTSSSSIASISDSFTLKTLLGPRPRIPPHVAMPTKSSGGLVLERKSTGKSSTSR